MKKRLTRVLTALLLAALLLSSAAPAEELLALETAEELFAPETAEAFSEPEMAEELSEPEMAEEILSEAVDEAVAEEMLLDHDIPEAESDPGEAVCEEETEFLLEAQSAGDEAGLFAADTAPEDDMVFEEIFTDPIADGDELFAGYVQGLFGVGGGLFAARNVGLDLTGNRRALYDYLKGCVLDIAAGKRSSTKCTFSTSAVFATADIRSVVNCLIADHPYEMFWYANGLSYTQPTGGGDLTVCLNVNEAYASGTYQVNTAMVSKAARSAANARAIVNKYAGKSDYDKLAAYRDAICDAVSYNTAATQRDWNKGFDPWQLIWVFDGDSSTNVVCEGYAKAFQYLCDMSSFAGYVVCYSVTGDAQGQKHKWNIVRMPNGRNYHVDVTWCDQEGSGTYDWFFMKAPVKGSVSEGYSFRVQNAKGVLVGTYQYDANAPGIYKTSDLTLSAGNYLDEAGLKPAVTPPPAPTLMPTIAVARKSVKATVYVGKQYKIDLNGATAKSFKSSKKKVATVDGNGIVTPRAQGKTKITIRIGKKKRVLTLTVKDPTIPTRVTLNMSGTVPVKKGTSVTLTATLPAGTNSGIKWKSSNKKIATVKNGVVTFKKKGKVTITATAVRGKKKARVKFKVSN